MAESLGAKAERLSGNQPRVAAALAALFDALSDNGTHAAPTPDSARPTSAVPTGRPDLLTPGDLRVILGLKHSVFHQHQKRGAFKHLEVKRPIGLRRYSRALVEQFVAGESTVPIGRGSRRGR